MTTPTMLLTDWFKTNYSTITWDGSQKIGVDLYSRAPLFSTTSATSFASIQSVSEIASRPEWVPINATLTSKTSLTGSAADLFLTKISLGGTEEGLQVVDSGGIFVSVEDGAGWYLATDPTQVSVSAAVFYLIGTFSGVTNPVLFASTQGIGPNTVAHYQSVYGQFETGAVPGQQYIIGYDTSSTNFFTGYTLLSLSTPIWEGAHAQHLWIQPQRTNFIANPSFEKAGPVYWRAGRNGGAGSATLSRAGTSGTPAGVGGKARPYCGKVLSSGGSGERSVLESNLFPKVGAWYSVSFYASGDGDISSGTGDLFFGIVCRPADAGSAIYVRNGVAEGLGGGTATTGFKKFTALIQIPDDITDLMFRIEYSGTTLWVDHVLVDPHEGQYEYFDGSSTDGLIGDFRWMGGGATDYNASPPTHTGYAHTHFSMWYNNYVNTRSRLIGDYDTLDNLYKPGLVEDWAPTGANITAHWDAVTNVSPLNWIGDTFYPITDVNGTNVSTITGTLDFLLAPV